MEIVGSPALIHTSRLIAGTKARLPPGSRLVGTLYVLIRLHEQRPPRHLRRVFALAERLRPWSMIEVFVFGVFVAYVKLGDLVTIGLMAGVILSVPMTVPRSSISKR